jgi:hypothetical protein
MAGLGPAIHDFLGRANQDVDARNKCGHDEVEFGAVLAAIVSVLGFGPTLTKARRRPHSDSTDKLPRSRGAGASEFCQSQVHEKPLARKATRVLKWSAGRRRGRGPRHADGCCHPPTLRAWRAPQNDPLTRTACFGRAAPPGAPPPSRFSAAAVDRRRASSAPASPRRPASSTGILTVSGMIHSFTRNIDRLSRIDSYRMEPPMRLNLSPRRLSDQ